MWPVTHLIPKPLMPFRNSTLIEESIKQLKARVARVHVTVGYKKGILVPHVIDAGASSIIDTEGQSNAWWLHHSLLRNLDKPIYVFTCDNVVNLDFDLLEKSYLSLDCPPCMIVPVKPVEGLDGDYIFHHDSYVTDISRKKVSSIYCSGIQIINPKKAADLTPADVDFYGIWQALIENKALRVSSVYPKEWHAIDTLEQLERLKSYESNFEKEPAVY
jgi:NDP-sugar pyrophosphorylase family protein